MKQLKIYVSLLLSIALILGAAPLSIGAEETAVRYLISEDFQQDERPDTLVYNDGSGDIHVETIGTNKALFMQNDSDGSYTVLTKNFGSVTAGTVTAEVKFLQPNRKADGNIIMELLSGSGVVAAIVTDSGNISIKLPNGSYKPLISNYYANIWYGLKVVADIAANTCDFYVDGNLILSAESFVTSVASVDTISSYAIYSPGYQLDDLKVSTEVAYGSLVLNGASRGVIPAAGESVTQYNATLSGAAGDITGETLNWSISGDTTGVSIVPSTDMLSAKLHITPSAINGGSVVISVATSGGTFTATKTVTLETVSASTVKISGDARVSTPDGKVVKFPYQATIYDQLGNEIPNQTFTWEVQNNSPATVSIDAAGVLSVSGGMPQKDEKLTVVARLTSDPSVSGSKSVLVQRYDTYFNDKQRLEAAITAVDSILRDASNPDGRNPLMSTYVSPYTHTYPYWNLTGPAQPTAVSNLTEQFQLMRAMDGITALTGDEKYKQRVRDIYKWQIDHGISRNGLVYWGNHTSMDLETGEWAEYFEKYATSNNFVEFKDRDVYVEPFHELDSNIVGQIAKDHWCAIIKDWGTMSFNRHALIYNTKDPDYSGWNDLAAFKPYPNADDPDRPTDPWVRSTDLSFSSSAACLIAIADYAYQKTGDRMFLTWASRLINRYIATRNPETKIFGYMFTSSKRMEGIPSLEDVYGEHWWTQPSTNVNSNTYGDRAYNQFAHMIAQNWPDIYTSEDDPKLEEEIWEGGFLQGDSGPFGSCFFIDVFCYAQTLMNDPDPTLQAEGKQLVIDVMQCMEGYIKYAYHPEDNNFHRIFSNGLDITGLIFTRPGYWGSIGKSHGTDPVSKRTTDTIIQGYLASKDIPELADEREAVWEALRNICDMTYRIGDIGNIETGERPKLNLAATTTESGVLRTMLRMYEATGWEEYLTMARVIGNNIVSSIYRNGYFIPNTNLQYVDTDGEYSYVLLKLEAYLRGEPHLVPDSRYINHHEMDASWIDDRGTYQDWISIPFNSLTYPSVKVKSIRTNIDTIELKLGETASIEVEVRPDDASSKGYYWDIDDDSIVTTVDNNTFLAKKEGTTIAYAVSKSAIRVKSKPVYITVTR